MSTAAMSIQEKLELIRNNFPNLKTINPYMDRWAIMDVKKFLCDVGAYKIRPCELQDTTVINLIVRAQGKKTFMHYVHGASRRKSG